MTQKIATEKQRLKNSDLLTIATVSSLERLPDQRLTGLSDSSKGRPVAERLQRTAITAGCRAAEQTVIAGWEKKVIDSALNVGILIHK